MTVHLETAEGELLLELVDEKVRQLQIEIRHTDNRDFRRYLRRRLEMLEAIGTRLQAERPPATSGDAVVDYEFPPAR